MSHAWKKFGVTTIVDPAIFQSKCTVCGLMEHRQYAGHIREMDEAYGVKKEGEYVDRVWWSKDWPPSERLEVEPSCVQSSDVASHRGMTEMTSASRTAAR